jgi:hypothetical protein
MEVVLVRNPQKFMNLSQYSRKIKLLTIKQRIRYYLEQALALRTSYGGIRIYELMAEAYEKEAAILCQNKIEIVTQVLTEVEKKYFEARKKITEFDNRYNETPEYQLLYGIKYKKVFFKIQGDYWDTMKKMQESQTYTLTQKQLDYINQQIETEISTEIFKSIMGLNNYTKCQNQITKILTLKSKQIRSKEQ